MALFENYVLNVMRTSPGIPGKFLENYEKFEIFLQGLDYSRKHR